MNFTGGEVYGELSSTVSTEMAGPPKTSVLIYQTIRRHVRKRMTVCHARCLFAEHLASLSISQTALIVRPP